MQHPEQDFTVKNLLTQLEVMKQLQSALTTPDSYVDGKVEELTSCINERWALLKREEHF